MYYNIQLARRNFSDINLSGKGSMVDCMAKYTANTGMATISTANANLDGTGTLATVLTASANGTFIKSVIVEAKGTVNIGMVRLFVKSPGGNSE